jgi:nitroreductase
VVDDPQVLEEIGKIQSPISETFVRENYQQLSFSEEELRRKKVGLLSAMFPPSWTTPGVQPTADPGRSRSFPVCPTLRVVLYNPARRAPASEGDFLGIISLGCVMENMWLMASSLGIDFHIVSSLGGGQAAAEIKRILAVPERLQVAYTIRLGYAPVSPAHPLRVRREVDEFSHHNHYASRD